MSTHRLTDHLHKAAASVWDKCLQHPFVRSIGDGTLDMEKFRYFMLQDYLYLFEYARVFAMGVVKARDPDLMRTFAANVDATLNGEMNLHRAYMKQLGITEEQVMAVQPALDNISYTNYMLSVACTGGLDEIVASILACAWSYAEIGKELAAIPGATEHPLYGEWIKSYSGPGYRAVNDALIDLMNRLAADADGARIQRLTEIFVNCSRFELGFWDMAWEMRA